LCEIDLTRCAAAFKIFTTIAAGSGTGKSPLIIVQYKKINNTNRTQCDEHLLAPTCVNAPIHCDDKLSFASNDDGEHERTLEQTLFCDLALREFHAAELHISDATLFHLCPTFCSELFLHNASQANHHLDSFLFFFFTNLFILARLDNDGPLYHLHMFELQHAYRKKYR
jgi:hypothetical protein